MYFYPFIKKMWDSPTITTWGSFLSKPLSLIVLTPLIVTKLPIEQVSVWYLFSTYIGLQSLADLGLNNSFIRAYCYAIGGASEIKIIFRLQDLKENNCETNWDLIEKTDSTIKRIYLVFAVVLFLILSIIGSLTLVVPIQRISFQTDIWIAWSLIIAITSINLYGQRYQIYLMGMNKVSLLMRWQTLFSFLTTISAIITLTLTNRLLYLVISVQFWALLNVIRNRSLSRYIYDQRFTSFHDNGFDKNIFRGVIPSGWRNWIAQLMSFGLVQLSGIFYAQIGDSSNVATYLFSLRIMDLIKSFSLAPFYSKIPILTRLFSENKLSLMLKTASKGMFLAHLSFVVPFMLAGLAVSPLLQLIHANVYFASPLLWSILGFAYWTERFGGMHIQLYNLCNDTKAHIANGVSGIIYIFFSLFFYQLLGVYVFPLGLIIGNTLFFMPYAARYSYKFYGLKFWHFEKNISIPAAVVLLVYMCFQIIFKYR